MLVIGNYINDVKCESFKDNATGRIRIRPLPNQEIPTDLLIECRKTFRVEKNYPLGTTFIAENVKVCQKTTGRLYLRAKDQHLSKI